MAKISPSELITLKSKIESEFSSSDRRGGTEFDGTNGTTSGVSYGSLKQYTGASQAFTITPQYGIPMRREWKEKTENLLLVARDKVGSILANTQYSGVMDSFNKSLLNDINSLASVQKTSTSGNGGCRGACTGLCAGSCVGACNGCTGCTASCGTGCASGCRKESGTLFGTSNYGQKGM